MALLLTRTVGRPDADTFTVEHNGATLCQISLVKRKGDRVKIMLDYMPAEIQIKRPDMRDRSPRCQDVA